MVRVRDLVDQVFEVKYPGRFLLCRICGGEYSAHKGDYWNHPQEYVFKCCDEPMSLMTKKQVYTEIKIEGDK